MDDVLGRRLTVRLTERDPGNGSAAHRHPGSHTVDYIARPYRSFVNGFTTSRAHAARELMCGSMRRSPTSRAIGFGINLQPNAVRELIELGLAETLAAT